METFSIVHMQICAKDKFYLHSKYLHKVERFAWKFEIFTNFIYTKHKTCNSKNMILKKLLNMNRDEHGFF
jgi:hypothetical protein